MKAVCWMGTSNVETLTVADPKLMNPHDAIIKITRTVRVSPWREELLAFMIVKSLLEQQSSKQLTR
jgi:hypothetical protein